MYCKEGASPWAKRCVNIWEILRNIMKYIEIYWDILRFCFRTLSLIWIFPLQAAALQVWPSKLCRQCLGVWVFGCCEFRSANMGQSWARNYFFIVLHILYYIILYYNILYYFILYYIKVVCLFCSFCQVAKLLGPSEFRSGRSGTGLSICWDKTRKHKCGNTGKMFGCVWLNLFAKCCHNMS